MHEVQTVLVINQGHIWMIKSELARISVLVGLSKLLENRYKKCLCRNNNQKDDVMKSLNQLKAMKSLAQNTGCKDMEVVLMTDGMDDTLRQKQTELFTNKVRDLDSANVALIAVKF